MEGKRRTRRARKGSFLRFLAIYSLVLMLLVGCVWGVLYLFIGDYEESRPGNTMDSVVEQLLIGDVAGVIEKADIKIDDFTRDRAVFIKNVSERLSAGDISYKKKNGEYSDLTPVYVIYQKDKPVFQVALTEESRSRFDFIRWKVGEVRLLRDSTDKSFDGTVRVVVPENAEVRFGKEVLKDSYVTEASLSIEAISNVHEYLDRVPVEVEYTVSDMVIKPEVSVSLDGSDLTVLQDEEGVYRAAYPKNDALREELLEQITQLNHDYGAYIINKGSLAKLKQSMVGNARTYVSDIPAIWAFLTGKNYNYEFLNEQISDFRMYSDSCFAVDVDFALHVTWDRREVTYDTKLTYIYVKRDDDWVVADFAIR